MNTLTDISSENKTCGGKCIIEMQRVLEPSVIAEFFEVIRDFHNDDRTAAKIKNIILSETSDAVKLLNERASEMILMVDEIFLNRRQRQTSFYRLCHQLARKGLPEGSHLPDESRCVCFSEENLRRFNVDPGANTSLEFSSNLMSVKKALKQYFGELRCSDCGRFMQLPNSSFVMNHISDCSCFTPSVNSQHAVHEAILELCKANEDKDSWYLTQLKRDAEYYRKRHRNSSISSENSFEVISPSSESNFKENDTMDNESLGNDFEMLNKIVAQKNVCPMTKCPAADIQDFSRNLSNKLLQSFSPPVTNVGNSQCTPKMENKAGNITIIRNKSSPAAALRQSFSPYFDKSKNAQAYCSVKRNLSACPAEYLTCKLQKLHFNRDVIDFKPSNKNINYSNNESNPSDALKLALNSYLKKEASINWLRN